MTILWPIVFILAVIGFWSLNLLGLPGNWLIVAAAVLYAWLIPSAGSGVVRWSAVGVVATLAMVGEVVETGASAAGVRRVGGSRRGAAGALIGSIVGALMGVFIGFPVPLIGSVVAAILFAGLGATCGAWITEFSAGRSAAESLRIGRAAFWGRLKGTLAKTLVGAVMVGVSAFLAIV